MGVVGAKKWTSEDDALLRSLYASLDAKEVGHRLGRSPSSVTARAHKIGATRRVWNTNLPSALRQEVLSLYDKGMTVAQVQEATRLSYHQVRGCLSDAGVTPDRVRASKIGSRGLVRSLTPKEQDQVRVLWEAGASIAKIASTLGCWVKVIQRFCRTNLPPRSLSFVMSTNSGVRKNFSQEEQTEIVRLYTSGLQSESEIAHAFGCGRIAIRDLVRSHGVDTPSWHRKKLSVRALDAYRSGHRVVSANAGRGIKTPYNTPFQGVRVLRSSTEAARARSLDAAGVTWFYEVQRFPLAAGDTYLPDFWITEVPLPLAQMELGPSPSVEAILAFLQVTPHTIEDVKGWYDAQHPSKEKINRFTAEYPDLYFRINVFKSEGV